MNIVFKWLDAVWNLKYFEGHRTKIAQAVLGGISAYQGVATSADLIKSGIDLPDIPTTIFVGAMAYFAGKVAQFAREHK